MSNAYARMARESATVMHKTKDYFDPPMNGIWGKIELPALRDKTDVKEVGLHRSVLAALTSRRFHANSIAS